jgi:hypothetical protein
MNQIEIAKKLIDNDGNCTGIDIECKECPIDGSCSFRSRREGWGMDCCYEDNKNTAKQFLLKQLRESLEPT